ncbi:MAG: hypothetical protein HYW70_00885 [Candidatus Nealsonbacteria bacterium]|nr:hypothetical protein [Candidatus Nealsonbacteria bacterium]
MKRVITIAIIAVAAISGIMGYWYYQRNIYSKEILRLEIIAKDAIQLGEEIEYTVKYKNNGDITLEEPRLIFEFPQNSILQNGQTKRQQTFLNDIYPGEGKTISFKARLLGKEGETKEAKALLSYRPKNLKARYESETSHIALIKSAPITFEMDLPSKIESGKEISFRLNYFSNIDYPLSGLGIIVEYPSGFNFSKAVPKGLDKTQWDIGLLNKADGGKVEITGNLSGEIGEEKEFKAELGLWQDGEFIPLKETIKAAIIVKPALYIIQHINGNPQYVASPGDTLHYEIFFRNIGEDAMDNLFLIARLDGKAFDFSTIKSAFGDFEPGDNSIIFDWRKVPKLQLLAPQEEGKIEFWISLKERWDLSGDQDKNPVIRNKIYLSQAREEFENKVNSRIEVVQKGVFEDEVFGNTGERPPRVGQPTTYTITWQAKNYFNDVKGAKIRAVLGKGVRLTGKIFPEDSSLTFDSQSREVVWRLGDLEAGRGVLNPVPNVSFQIEFIPVQDQRGKVITLIGDPEISGEDQWTGQNISGKDGKVESEAVQ